MIKQKQKKTKDGLNMASSYYLVRVVKSKVFNFKAIVIRNKHLPIFTKVKPINLV